MYEYIGTSLPGSGMRAVIEGVDEQINEAKPLQVCEFRDPAGKHQPVRVYTVSRRCIRYVQDYILRIRMWVMIYIWD